MKSKGFIISVKNNMLKWSIWEVRIMFKSKINEIKEVPLAYIKPNPNQPRKFFNDADLIELASSIQEIGIIQPIILKRNNAKDYVIIAGERRYRAAQIAGLKKVPAIINSTEGSHTMVMALVENIQRENLNFLEEAMAIKELVEGYGLSQNEISKKIGKSQSAISNKMRILALPEDILDKLVKNQLTERHGRALLGLTDKNKLDHAIGLIIEKKLNVKETEALVKALSSVKKFDNKSNNVIKYINYRIYLNTLKNAFNSIYDNEKQAVYSQVDCGDYMEVIIKIPKDKPKLIASS